MASTGSGPSFYTLPTPCTERWISVPSSVGTRRPSNPSGFVTGGSSQRSPVVEICGRGINAGHLCRVPERISTRVPTIACPDVSCRRSPSSQLSKNTSLCRDNRHLLRRSASQRLCQNPPYNQQVIGSSPVAPTGEPTQAVRGGNPLVTMMTSTLRTGRAGVRMCGGPWLRLRCRTQADRCGTVSVRPRAPRAEKW
jgi:hypothetical protein